jgi:hypothetical protein
VLHALEDGGISDSGRDGGYILFNGDGEVVAEAV